MEPIPSSVYGTIRLALEANLREYHRLDGVLIENADLYADIISAVKWASEKSEQTAAAPRAVRPHQRQHGRGRSGPGDGCGLPPPLPHPARLLAHGMES